MSKTTKKTFFIVAGNTTEAENYAATLLDPKKHSHVIVSDANDLRGPQVRPGEVLYVGTFYRREDLEEIATNVAFASRLPAL